MQKNNLLVEILTEELPPLSQRSLAEVFAQNISESIHNLGLSKDINYEVFSTPRRLGVLVRDVSFQGAIEKKVIKLMPASIGFDDKGRCISLSGGKVGKPIKWSHVYKYNDKGYMYILESKNKKGETTEVQQNNYYKDHPGLYDFVKMNGKGDTLEYTVREPIDSITNTSYDKHYKKGKLKYTWHNEYYPNGQQKRTTATDGKGKVRYVWNFECDARGVEAVKHKDTSKLCVSREYDKDSMLTKVSLAVDEKGEVYKTVEKRNKFKKRLATIRTNETKGFKESEYTNRYASDGQTILFHDYKSYYKGKLRYNSQTAYDRHGNITGWSVNKYKKGVLHKSVKEAYQFDSKNRPIVYQSTLENGKLNSVIRFTYDK